MRHHALALASVMSMDMRQHWRRSLGQDLSPWCYWQLREEVRLRVLHLVLGFFILTIMLLWVVAGRRSVELSGRTIETILLGREIRWKRISSGWC
jgi:uncharacterized iron-regulated membrane protein